MRGIMSRISSDTSSRALDERESIVGHLQALLNSRKGQSPVCPDYGVIDMVDLVHAFPRALSDLQKSIRDTIQEYEPRLKNVRVRHITDEHDVLTMHFEVTGQLSRPGSRSMLRFRTQVNSSGNFDVT